MYGIWWWFERHGAEKIQDADVQTSHMLLCELAEPLSWFSPKCCCTQVRVNVEAWLATVEGGMQQSLRKLLRTAVRAFPSQVCL